MGRRTRRKEKSDRTLSLAPRLFINALIRGELLEYGGIRNERRIHIAESRCVPLISPVVLTDATRFYNLSRRTFHSTPSSPLIPCQIKVRA